MGQHDYAIIVGINKYKRVRELKGPVNDAMCFREWLLASDGGDVPPDHVFTVLSDSDTSHDCPDPNLPPGTVLASIDYSTIEDIFNLLVDQIDQVGKPVGQRLYCFLAGHGLGPTPYDTVILMSDGNYGRFSGFHIPGSKYVDWFRFGATFHEVVLFMDCCRDNPGQVTLKPAPWPPDNSPGGANVRYFYGFGTKWSRKARERQAPGEDHYHGVFTHALLEALKHVPSNEDGQVMASSIAGYVRTRLKALEKEGFYEPGEADNRRPEFLYPEDTDFVMLTREPTTATLPVRITFSLPDPGLAVRLRSSKVVEGEFELVDELAKMTGVWDLQLEAGLWLVQGVDPVTGTIAKELAFSVTGQEVTNVTF